MNTQKIKITNKNDDNYKIKIQNNIKTIKQNMHENIKYSLNNTISPIKNSKNLLISNESIYNDKNYINIEDCNSPEELHFYYIFSIQRGKINENKY